MLPTLYICGARGSFPVSGDGYVQFGRSTTCYVLRLGARAVVVDCGTGLFSALSVIKGCTDIDIVLTHYHLDHIAGLWCCPPALPEEYRLRFFLPRLGDSDPYEALTGLLREPYWPVSLQIGREAVFPVTPGESLELSPDIRLFTMAGNHPGGCMLLRLEAANAAAVFAFDHEHGGGNDELIEFARGADALIYDAAYTDAEYPAHRSWGHSTAERGLETARAAGVGLYMPSHHSSHHDDSTLLALEERIKRIFPNTRFAREGESVELTHGSAARINTVTADAERVLELGLALSSERDSDGLMRRILSEAMLASNADAGTLYLYENGSLKFHIMRNSTMGVDLGGDEEISYPPVPMEREFVCAYAALERKTVIIDDVYKSTLFDFSGPMRYDAMTGYRTTSMLVVPLTDDMGGLTGVLQLINALGAEGGPVPFDGRRVRAVETLARFSAIAMRNIRHTVELKEQMFSFMDVIITTMDARTPYNASHTTRIAAMMKRFLAFARTDAATLKLMGPIDARREDAMLAGAWLHDIGKLVTPLDVMNKASRLDGRLEIISARLERIGLLERIAVLEHRLTEEEYSKNLARLQEIRAFVEHIDSAAFLTAEDDERAAALAGLSYTDFDGTQKPYFTHYELECLGIHRGTLTKGERWIMERHAETTKLLLDKMNFSEDYGEVRLWASAHHEKLNGKGYPDGLSGERIPMEARLLTVLDILEALTTAERPYKKAIEPATAFDILRSMAENGEIDGDIVAAVERCGCWK